MGAGGVDMTVFNFVLGSLSDEDNLDIEGEVNSGEGVVGIDGNIVSINGGDGGDGGAGLGLCLKLHSGDEFGVFGELGPGGLNNEFRIVFTVGLCGGDIGDEGITCGLAFELFFQAADDISVSVEVGEGVPTFAGIDDVTLGIRQFVMHGDDGVFCNLHS